MSDQGRRHDDIEVRERLTKLEAMPPELIRVRERVHDLAQCTQQLVAASEDAADARQAMAQKIDNLSEKVDSGTLASARAEVQLGATMAAHIEQCKTDKAEQKAMITKLGADRERMHQENQTKLDAMSQEFRELHWSAVKWLAAVGGSLIIGLVSVAAYLVTNGAPWQHH